MLFLKQEKNVPLQQGVIGGICVGQDFMYSTHCRFQLLCAFRSLCVLVAQGSNDQKFCILFVQYSVLDYNQIYSHNTKKIHQPLAHNTAEILAEYFVEHFHKICNLHPNFDIHEQQEKNENRNNDQCPQIT